MSTDSLLAAYAGALPGARPGRMHASLILLVNRSGGADEQPLD